MRRESSVSNWRIPPVVCVSIAVGFIALQALALLAMGRPPICTCGTLRFWTGIVTGPENSQQFTDWYTSTHVIHGIGLYLALWLVAPRMSFLARLTIAVGLESAWEIVENTPLVIERYRQSALAQGYFGDSVVNSVADTLAAAVGFVLARILPVWLTVALAVAIELFVGIMIRDNLTLNVIQLLSPSDAISRWQNGK